MDIFKYINFMYIKIWDPHEEKHAICLSESGSFAKMMLWCLFQSLWLNQTPLCLSHFLNLFCDGHLG